MVSIKYIFNAHFWIAFFWGENHQVLSVSIVLVEISFYYKLYFKYNFWCTGKCLSLDQNFVWLQSIILVFLFSYCKLCIICFSQTFSQICNNFFGIYFLRIFWKWIFTSTFSKNCAWKFFWISCSKKMVCHKIFEKRNAAFRSYFKFRSLSYSWKWSSVSFKYALAYSFVSYVT